MEYHRIRATVSAEVACNADAFFEVLRDFAGVMRWMPRENPPLRLTKVELAPGHDVRRRPCIRHAYQDKSGMPEEARALSPDIVEEELLCDDPVTRTFSYNLLGEPYGLRNYVALIEVDSLGANQCRVTCSSRWDAPDLTVGMQMRGAVEDLFRRGVIEGIATVVREQG